MTKLTSVPTNAPFAKTAPETCNMSARIVGRIDARAAALKTNPQGVNPADFYLSATPSGLRSSLTIVNPPLATLRPLLLPDG